MKNIGMVDYTKCMAVTGFNSKQVWVYDEEHDTYIDPPKAVLDEIEEKASNINNAVEALKSLIGDLEE